jgi:hypothetical protein
MTCFRSESVGHGRGGAARVIAIAATWIAAAGCSGADPSSEPGATAMNDEPTDSVSSAVSAVGTASAHPDAGTPPSGAGEWLFDDCSPTSHVLAQGDEVAEGDAPLNAWHALRAHCVPGVSGLAVEFRSARDVVEIPDAPQFAVTDRVAVAAWVYPNTVTGHHPILIKGRDDRASFSLAIHEGNVEMSVLTARGRTVVTKAPIAARAWTHVAGWYDGTYLQLLINGQGFPQVEIGERLRNVFAPILVGATGERQFFDGIIDNVYFSTEFTLVTELNELACVNKPSSVSINPATGGPVTFDTPVHYDVVVTNNSIGECGPLSVNTFAEVTDPTITEQFANGGSSTVQPGMSTDIGVDVTANDAATPGVHLLPIKIIVTIPNPPDFSQQTSIEELSFDLEPSSAQAAQ